MSIGNSLAPPTAHGIDSLYQQHPPVTLVGHSVRRQLWFLGNVAMLDQVTTRQPERQKSFLQIIGEVA